MQDELLRWPTVHLIAGLSRTTAWRMERSGLFPARRQIGANSVGWLRSEINAWIADRSQVSTIHALPPNGISEGAADPLREVSTGGEPRTRVNHSKKSAEAPR